MEIVEPAYRQYLYLCPIAVPTDSLRNVMLRGWSLGHRYVYNGLAINGVSGLGFLVLAALTFRRNS